jgi:hypothetical protein
MTTRTHGRFTLGANLARLWAAGAISNLGDGVTIAAGPLLVASLTRDPALVAGAAFAQQLPWLLFSLAGGWYAATPDRTPIAEGIRYVRRHRQLRTLPGLRIPR